MLEATISRDEYNAHQLLYQRIVLQMLPAAVALTLWLKPPFAGTLAAFASGTSKRLLGRQRDVDLLIASGFCVIDCSRDRLNVVQGDPPL